MVVQFCKVLQLIIGPSLSHHESTDAKRESSQTAAQHQSSHAFTNTRYLLKSYLARMFVVYMPTTERRRGGQATEGHGKHPLPTISGGCMRGGMGKFVTRK